MSFAFFAEMAWKSALIAGAALTLAYVLRSRSAADRALVLRLGVAMLLALPAIALLLPALEIAAFAPPDPAAGASLTDAQIAAFLSAAASAPAATGPTIWDDPTPLVLLAWLGGVAMAGSRLVGGLWTLSRWTRQARSVDCPEWLAAFDRVRWAAKDGERLRLLVSDAVPSPLSWGWRNPVVLIDPDTLAQADQAEAILAHEVAHVARRDWPVLMMTRVAAALFWFNPLVWLLEREVVQQAEEAADCAAAERVEPARYAQTLLSWAQSESQLPANSIAPSARALARRIRAVLDRRARERPSGSAWTALAMLACIGIAAPVAAMQLVEAARAPEAPSAPTPPRNASERLAVTLATAPDAPYAPLSEAEIAEIESATEETLREVLPRIPEIVARAQAAMPPEEIERITREALRAVEASQALTRVEVAQAVREAHRASAHARVQVRAIPHAEIEAAVRAATAEIPHAVVRAMAANSDDMLRGAEGMEAGARRMEDQARRLRGDRAYRERHIARARERGETVTHEDLIEAADGMVEGAEGMREGARGMREAAREMRETRR